MDKKQSQNIVKETFQKSFDKDKFLYFIKNLLNKIDEKKAFHARGYVPETYKNHIKTYERLATYTDPNDNKIDILVVYLQKDTTLDRARTAQRNFLARYLKDRDQKEAGLVAFVAPGSSDWRFSLVKMDYKFEEGESGKYKVKEEFTPARRWSFLVGSNENSHTAQSRLAPIVEDDRNNPTLEQLEDAFNIEKVTKEFFEKYRELFLRTYENLNDILKLDATLKKDFVEKRINTVDFSKKLLGQIVFLYFLQKKGWFGVPMKKQWGEGDKKFLRSLFIKATTEKINYFNDLLEPLFYEALAKERDNDFYSRFECKIPFLNGGLFDPINNYDWVNTEISLPNELFSNTRKTQEGDIGDGILDIFDRYNFTVKEDEPLEKEVAVDPEMLGKVFENLLEVKDRKSKGTYYTPREIVHYMCQQSLVNYLTTELNGKVSKDDLENLIRHGEAVSENEARVENEGKETDTYYYIFPENIRKYDRDIDATLARINICDPATGSGAFLVGMMNEIVKVRLTLNAYLCEGQTVCENRTPYDFKFHCIQNSLYGVDIDPSAVEIAKLRLWLSLVVDEEDINKIKPLPNLDYKIMQGNSLLEEYEGIKLFDEKIITKTDSGQAILVESLKKKQTELQRVYIALHSKNKLTSFKQAELNDELTKINNQLKKLNNSNINNNDNGGLFDLLSEAKRKAEELKHLHKVLFETTQKKKKDEIKLRIETIEWDLIEATLKEQNKMSALKKLWVFKKSNTKPFFLWKLHFADVFEEKGGFDVVIGNPPYISAIQNSKDEKDDRSIYKHKYPLVKGSFDIYTIFLLKGMEVSNAKGIYAWIIPNKFMISKYSEDVLALLKQSSELNVISVSHLSVFEGVGVYPIIILGSKSKIDFNYYEVNQLDDLAENILLVKRTTLGVYKNFKDYGIKIASGATGFQAKLLSKYISEHQSNSSIPFVVSGSIDPWLINYEKVRYMGKIYKKAFITKGKNIADSKWSFWLGEKIIISGMTKRIEAVYKTEPLGLGVGIYAIYYYSKFNPKFILGVLNSKFITYYLLINFQEKHLAGGYLAINKSTIEQLPLVDADIEHQKPIIELVDKIINITKSHNYINNSEKQSKVRDYEKQIDKIVYNLYGLTEEDIRIIELGDDK